MTKRPGSLLMQMAAALVVAVAAAGCGSGGARVDGTPRVAPPPGAEAISFLGDTLYPPVIPEETRRRYERQLADAREVYERTPDDADATIWLGRRVAYLGRYREAIGIFTQGLADHPGDARFLRHRGHRYITVRRLDDAIADLTAAARMEAGKIDAVEPDGQPNARNIPTSTLQSNIWYHLGLAHYLRGDLEDALRAYRECLNVSRNDDMKVATLHWLYMTLRRLGRPDEAAAALAGVRREMDVIENQSYHRLLLLYRNELPVDSLLPPAAPPGSGEAGGAARSPSDASAAYGVGNWHLYNGRRDEAVRVFRRLVAARAQWPSFGYAAAEADLRRLGAGAGAAAAAGP